MDAIKKMLVICIAVFPTEFASLGTDARVVRSFSECTGDHFYRGIPPNVDDDRTHLAKICQTYNNREHFATVYNKSTRTPVYSAYQVQGNAMAGPATRRGSENWFVEPFGAPNSDGNMVRWPAGAGYPLVQAVDLDYRDTNYDRIPLNPNGHHRSDDARTATFTLTNVVPQDPCFNRLHWNEMEKRALQSLQTCDFNGAKRYVVTGAVASSDLIIPTETDRDADFDDDNLRRVNVPRYMWSALCCDSSGAAAEADRMKGWSYAYYGENHATSVINVLPVSELQENILGNTQIFAPYGSVQNCVFDERETTEKRKTAELAGFIHNLRIMQAMSSTMNGVEMTIGYPVFISEETEGADNKNLMRVQPYMTIATPMNNEVLGRLQEDNLFCEREPCVSMAPDTDTIRCNVKPIRQRGHITTQGHRCRSDHQCARRGQHYSWCFTEGDTRAKCCESECIKGPADVEYTCDIGSGEYKPCSPHMTVDTTLDGTVCRADHRCGRYGYSYSWCYIPSYDRIGRKKWKYCCESWDSCGRNGKDHDWCRVGDWNMWRNCTTAYNK